MKGWGWFILRQPFRRETGTASEERLAFDQRTTDFCSYSASLPLKEKRPGAAEAGPGLPQDQGNL